MVSEGFYYWVDVFIHHWTMDVYAWGLAALAYVTFKQRERVVRLVDPVYRDHKVQERRWDHEDRVEKVKRDKARDERERVKRRETTKRMMLKDREGMAQLRALKAKDKARRLEEDRERESEITHIKEKTPTARGATGA